MNPHWFFSLPEGVTFKQLPEGRGELTCDVSSLPLGRDLAELAAPLARLLYPGSPLSVLATLAPVARVLYLLQHLAAQGWLNVTVREHDVPIITALPFAPWFTFRKDSPGDADLLLSRFAYLRRHEGAFCLESPQAMCRVIVHDPRAIQIIHLLARPQTVASLSQHVRLDSLSHLLTLLWALGMLTSVADDGQASEDANPSLRAWEFHDRLFHFRCRRGRIDAPSGATFPLAGVVPPWPAVPEIPGPLIDLDRPSLPQLRANDPPLTQVIEDRRSIREYGPTPLTANQLGELLFRVARIRDRTTRQVDTPAGPMALDFTARPYPAGGALYELEIYPVVKQCGGLEPGLYHYDAAGHRLGVVASEKSFTARLLNDAGAACGMAPESLQVLLVITARFPRLAWKYSTMAYALVLKDVGVLYQSMYLAATAMNLSPCALGLGDSDLFSKASGVDTAGEVSVGEFLLGSRP